MFTDRKDELLFVRFQIWFLKNVQLDISGYSRLTLKDRANLPTQRGNSSECGIFMLSFIAQSCCGGDFGFTLKDMPVIRRQFGEFILMSGRPSGMPTALPRPLIPVMVSQTHSHTSQYLCVMVRHLHQLTFYYLVTT